MSLPATATPIKPVRAAPPPAPRIFDTTPSSAIAGPLEPRLRELRARYADVAGRPLLEAMITREFPDKIAVVSSFGAESVVILHMLAEIDPTVPVLFLNTGKLFGETLRYRDRLQDHLKLTDLRAIGPHPRDEAEFDPDGTLWTIPTNAASSAKCCRSAARSKDSMRK
jgi:3'-phosphoadenosine 5'-phosphosulfate sulfotransferase (PAPS reductase)/FAD synthetase